MLNAENTGRYLLIVDMGSPAAAESLLEVARKTRTSPQGHAKWLHQTYKFLLKASIPRRAHEGSDSGPASGTALARYRLPLANIVKFL